MLLCLLNEWECDHVKETAVQNEKEIRKKQEQKKKDIDEELLTTNQQFVICVVGNVFLVVLEKVVNSKAAILAIKEGKK